MNDENMTQGECISKMQHLKMTEEDILFERHLTLLKIRGELRDAAFKAVEELNSFNERELPGQFLKTVLAVKETNGNLRGMFHK